MSGKRSEEYKWTKSPFSVWRRSHSHSLLSLSPTIPTLSLPPFFASLCVLLLLGLFSFTIFLSSHSPFQLLFFFNFHKHCHLFPYLKKIYGLNFEVLRLDLCLEMGFRVLSLPFMFFSLLWPSKFGFDAPQKLILMFTCATRCFLMLPTFNPDFFFVLWCQKLLQSLM